MDEKSFVNFCRPLSAPLCASLSLQLLRNHIYCSQVVHDRTLCFISIFSDCSMFLLKETIFYSLRRLHRRLKWKCICFVRLLLRIRFFILFFSCIYMAKVRRTALSGRDRARLFRCRLICTCLVVREYALPLA